jgi:hypothetical protein
MKDNIKINLIKLGCERMEKIDLSQYRVRWQVAVNTVMHPRAPL